MKQKKNPFKFGKVVTGGNFCNRKQEIKELKQFITDGYSVWLYSPRRYGKSSLIYKVFNEITNIKLIYFDLYNVFSTDDFCRKYSKLLAKELFDWRDEIKVLTKKMTHYFQNLYPKISFDETGTPSFSLEVKQIKDMADVEKILNIPGIIAKEKLQPICIAFDEFQEIERIDPFMINWMRSVFQTQENVSYIFLGSKQSLMRNIFSSVNSPFYEFAVKMDIKPISYNDLFEFIKSKFGQQKITILDKNINYILQVSECHPHFTQYFASVVFDMIRSGENQDVDNFKNIWLNKIIDSQSVIFQNIFDQLKNNQRRILSLIAIPDDRAELFSEETRNKFQLPASSSINTILKALMKKDLIHKADNSYKVNNPVFKAWLRQISK
ncbi:MAG: ATP-binding protein [Bacteroidales bacterium]|nr:ATP-binding protein [Bacteroidales bacterium]